MRIYKRGKIYWVAFYDARSKRTERQSTKCTDREAARRAGERIERDAADPGRAEAEAATLSGALDAVISTIAAAMGHTDSRMAEQVYAKMNSDQLGTLMGGPSTKMEPTDPELAALAAGVAVLAGEWETMEAAMPSEA